VGLPSWSEAAKLVVGPDTNGSVARLAIASNTTGDNPLLELFEGTTRRVFLNYDASGNICNLAAEESGSALAFQTAATERMRIDSSGNVGIGTSSPSSRFTVRAAAGGTDIADCIFQVLLGDDGTFGGGILAVKNAGNRGNIGNANGSPLFNFEFNNAPGMSMDKSGNLLVGTTSGDPDSGIGNKTTPGGQRFSVMAGSTNDNITYTLYSTGASAYRFYVGLAGTVFATNTSISAISDVRYKENIRDLDVGLAEIMQLQPRVFDWKEGKGKNTQNDRGFIAQEFEQVFPDLIDEWKDPAPEGEEPYKSVRQDLIPVLVKAIQELKAELETVKAELATLKG
jgi:hypothetical protein